MEQQNVNPTVINAQLAMLTEQRNMAQNQGVIFAGKIAELQEYSKDLSQQLETAHNVIQDLSDKLKVYEPENPAVTEATSEDFLGMLQNAETIPAAEATK